MNQQAPDLVALEAERQRCIVREHFRMARERARQTEVLTELPQAATCGWSAAEALLANATVDSLQPLASYLDGTATALR